LLSLLISCIRGRVLKRGYSKLSQRRNRRIPSRAGRLINVRKYFVWNSCEFFLLQWYFVDVVQKCFRVSLCLHFNICSRDGALRVELGEPDRPPIAASDFSFDSFEGSQAWEKLQNIVENTCDYDDIFYLGEQLWLALTATPIGPVIDTMRSKAEAGTQIQVRLNIVYELKHLPWEALYNRKIGPLAGEPTYSVVHDPPLHLASRIDRMGGR
jgi:hypothetical protein